MDTVSKQKRSEIMSKIGGKNTKPELIIRSILHSLGYRFRLHKKELPGVPDIVLSKYRTVIFVHGCFWHYHDACRDGKIPKSNQSYWISKLLYNREKDKRHTEDLERLGWKAITVWECETKNPFSLACRLICEISSQK